MNILLGKMERAYQKIPEKLMDYLYLAAFALVLTYDYVFLTRFDREFFRVFYMAGATLAGIVVVLRFLNIKNENKMCVCFCAAIILVGLVYFLIRHSFYFLILALLIVGALRIEEKKVLVVYILIATTFFLIMFTHYLITHPDWKNEYPKHFGSINTSDCQSMVFFILTVLLTYKGKYVGYSELILMAAIVLWFWSYTQASINMYCSMACILISGIAKSSSALQLVVRRKPRQVVGYIVSVSFLVCAAIMIILSIRYNPEHEKWRALNDAIHHRLESPHRMYALHPPCLWGTEFEQVGWGYSPGVDNKELYAQYGYTYIDSSYPNILINHGYLIFALIVGVMTYVSYRYAKKGDIVKVLLLAVIAVDCAAEGHLKEISCNVWLVLPFANLSESEIDPNNITIKSKN